MSTPAPRAVVNGLCAATGLALLGAAGLSAARGPAGSVGGGRRFSPPAPSWPC